MVRVVSMTVPEKVVDRALPPAEDVAARDEAIKRLVVKFALLPKAVEASDNGDVPPVAKTRRREKEAVSFDVKVDRYCSRPGRTERSWIRIKGVKHYCAS